MKKIVVFTPSYFCDTDITVVKHLQSAFQVEWYVVQRKGEEKYSEEYLRSFVAGTGVKLHYTSHTCRFRSQDFRRIMFRLVKEWVAIGADLIYTADINLYFIFAYFLYGRRIPFVMGIHDVEPHSSTVSSIGKDLTRKANRVIATEFVLYSKNQYQLFQTRFPRYKANFVGMSVKDFGEKIPSTHFQDDIRKLLFFGGLQPYKGVDLLIQAFECLIDEGVINLRLSINGRFSSEEYKKQCLSLIHHKEYYDLHLAFVDNKDVPELFSKNDVAVFPYRDATQSGPLMINLNYGLPIISPNHTCFADIYTDKKNAFFYADSFDYHSLKEALRRVSLISKEEYDVMLRECDALRCGYTEEAIVQNYISVFNRVMQEHPRKR